MGQKKEQILQHPSARPPGRRRGGGCAFARAAGVVLADATAVVVVVVVVLLLLLLLFFSCPPPPPHPVSSFSSPLFPFLTFSTLASPAPSPPLPPLPAPPAALPRRWPRHMSQAWAATTIARLVHMPRYSVMIGSSTGVCLTTRDPRRGYTLTICTTTFTVAPVATTQLCRFCINVPASVYLVGVAQTDERDVIVLCVSNTDMGFVQTAHTVECNATLVHMRCTTSH